MWPCVAVKLRVTAVFSQTPGPEAGVGAVMSLGLEKLTPCFQGILPSMLFTCAQDGTPNAAFLSHVDYIDATHVRCRSSSSTRAAATSPRTRTRSSA
jgi:hypothetical protein